MSRFKVNVCRGTHTHSLVPVLPFRTESGIVRLAFTHGGFSPVILDYLTRRDNSSVEKNEVPPKCDVTTALLILLKATGHGKQDLVEQVFAIDTYDWCSSGADALRYKITSTLGKVSGKEGVDRKRMLLSGADSEDIKRCLTRRLHENYVSMPTKRRKQERERASTTASSTKFNPNPKFRGGGRVPADVTVTVCRLRACTSVFR